MFFHNTPRPSAWRCILTLMCLAGSAVAQPPGPTSDDPDDPQPQVMPFPGQGPEGPDRLGPGGPGSLGPPGTGPERKLLKQFDADNDGLLNAGERRQARELIKKDKASGPARRGPRAGGPGGGPGIGGPTGMGGTEQTRPGIRISPDQVQPLPASIDLYDQSALRTLFIDFESTDWETELEDFNNTDVDVPATLTVDGRVYHNVGVHFRGASSYFAVGKGQKRSLNLSLDLADKQQNLLGYRTLNLLNSNGDASLMSTAIYSSIAQPLTAAPRANWARVVINGENWGVYVNVEQFNKDFTDRRFEAGDANAGKAGARWKVPGRPGGRSGLEYTGDDPAPYKQKFEIKSKDRPQDWQALINLCKVLNTTPPQRLEAELAPILDIDGVLKFLALDIALSNSDGYWTRASDYSIYRDSKGIFHIIPHDMNEALKESVMGPGGPGGPGGGGRRQRPGPGGPPAPGQGAEQPGLTTVAALQPPADQLVPSPGGEPPQRGPRPGGQGAQGGAAGITLDPLHGLTDATKPLRSKLLAVPALRERYLGYVRQIAEQGLDWNSLGPKVAAWRALLDEHVKQDTRKLQSHALFLRATSPDPASESGAVAASGRRVPTSIRGFADRRRAFLLDQRPPADPARPPSQEAR